MRINFFVGIEGTHSLLRRSLNTVSRDDSFLTFYGPIARSRLSEADLLTNLVNPYTGTDEVSIGITKTGANGPLLDVLWAQAPIGSRVWFFKSTDNNITNNLYMSFMEAAEMKSRIERISGMPESKVIEKIMDNSFSELTNLALDNLDTCATRWQADTWQDFNLETFCNSQIVDQSIKVRLKNKL